MAVDKTFNIGHTRLKAYVPIVETKLDKYNSMTVLVTINYERTSGYYISRENIPFAIYLDRKFYAQFFGYTAKIQLSAKNIPSIVDIYALPNNGFRFTRSPLIPGNKLRLWFKGLRSYEFDVERHDIYWDNATGTFEDKKIGNVDAATGEAGGRLINSGRFLIKSEIQPALAVDYEIEAEDGSTLLTESGDIIVVEYA